ncbi:unnamed protein product [Caenorhabditis auriculariae]|uniref:Transthyretin-like family protein n=1 Tax=Caenorhabditis auriculariae TaxID=2777116 RepID=A0A8S1HWV7_9PELO|nr:unnamed protein product [Caenorhabditis auriculariae]
MMRVLVVLLVLLGVATAFLGIGRQQSIAVSGRLICNGYPAGEVRLKLYEKDILWDTLMKESYSGPDGTFIIAGDGREITNIDPKLNIYHKCNYNGPCVKKFGITIPDQFISAGKHPRMTYDIGTLNLANNFDGQSTDCIN